MRTRFGFLSASGCLLCDELQNNAPLSVRLGRCPHPRNNILLESENFALLPDISPIVSGHCLLVPKEHFSSFAKVPASQTEELRHFKEDCACMVSRNYSAPLLFEHGSGPLEPRSGACVHHAHIHFLPLSAPVELWMSEFGEVRELGLAAQYELPDRFDLIDYLAYQDQRGRSFLVADLDERPPCQFIRRRVAQHFSLEDWHWESSFIRRLTEVPSNTIANSGVCPTTA